MCINMELQSGLYRIFQFILVFSWVMYQPPRLDNYRYPAWAESLGIIIGVIPMLFIPAGIVVQFGRKASSFAELRQVSSFNHVTIHFLHQDIFSN